MAETNGFRFPAKCLVCKEIRRIIARQIDFEQQQTGDLVAQAKLIAEIDETDPALRTALGEKRLSQAGVEYILQTGSEMQDASQENRERLQRIITALSSSCSGIAWEPTTDPLYLQECRSPESQGG